MPALHKPLPDIQRLKALFVVGDDGVLRWRTRRWRALAGQQAGRTQSDGRVCVKLDQEMFKAHRIVYAITHGVDPGEKQIDHIDGNPSNNAPENLRLADNSQNGANRGRTAANSSGFRNVTWDEQTQSWLVHVRANYKAHHIGRFKEKADAVVAAESARVRLHGEFGSTERRDV